MKSNSLVERTDTAFEKWDAQWQTEQGREEWLLPEPFVIGAIPTLRTYGVKSVLDLGCGVGRHALFLAKENFNVYACDASPRGVEYLLHETQKSNLTIRTELCKMTDLPYKIGSINCVLAWNVIYHGDISVVQRTISEICRIMSPQGIFIGTMLSKRNSEMYRGHQIAYNTRVNKHKSDKNHPHFYCSGSELISLLSAFEILLLRDCIHKGEGSYHWHFIAEKK